VVDGGSWRESNTVSREARFNGQSEINNQQ
jgi:hypothetical protein